MVPQLQPHHGNAAKYFHFPSLAFTSWKVPGAARSVQTTGSPRATSTNPSSPRSAVELGVGSFGDQYHFRVGMPRNAEKYKNPFDEQCLFFFFGVSMFFSIPAALARISVQVLASPTLLSFAKCAAGLGGQEGLFAFPSPSETPFPEPGAGDVCIYFLLFPHLWSWWRLCEVRLLSCHIQSPLTKGGTECQQRGEEKGRWDAT